MFEAADSVLSASSCIVEYMKKQATVQAYFQTSTYFQDALWDSYRAMPENSPEACEYKLLMFDSIKAYSDFVDGQSIEYICNTVESAFEQTAVLAEASYELYFKHIIKKTLTDYLSAGGGITYKLIQAGFHAGFAIGNYLTNNDTVFACKELIRANYYFAEGVMSVLNEKQRALLDTAVSTEEVQNDAARDFDAAYSLLRDCELFSLDAYTDMIEASLFVKEKNSVLSQLKTIEVKWKESVCHGGGNYSPFNISVLTVCCPTDVYVYDSSNNLVLSIEDEAVTYEDFSVAGCVFDGVKTIAIANIENYTIDISARESGTMSVVCTTYGEDDEILSTTNFTDVEISYGDSFTATSDGGSSAATLVKNDYEVIEPSSHETEESEIIYVSGIELSSEVLLLEPSEIHTLTATLENANATCPTLFWRSSDSGVVTVDEYGNLTAISEGTATVICEAIDGSAYASCTVYVGDHIPGDINADTKVDILDVVRLTRHLAGDEVDYSQSAADVNSDGAINTVDLVHLMKYIVGDPNTKL